jgi:CCR4-NOT complex subunit CAF16
MVGPNGAGKTTLLRVIAGKHMVDPEQVRVLGAPAFHDTSLSNRVQYLGGGFPFEVDVEVAALIGGVRNADAGRRRRLVELLGVDPSWHMHRVSDGQRRRVQLLLGLILPSELLLLDEVTTDLDLLARSRLLAFLREESEQRGTSIVYASHVLDRLETWATHLLYLRSGRVEVMSPLSEVAELTERQRCGVVAPLVDLIERWLQRDAG